MCSNVSGKSRTLFFLRGGGGGATIIREIWNLEIFNYIGLIGEFLRRFGRFFAGCVVGMFGLSHYTTHFNIYLGFVIYG